MGDFKYREPMIFEYFSKTFYTFLKRDVWNYLCDGSTLVIIKLQVSRMQQHKSVYVCPL